MKILSIPIDQKNSVLILLKDEKFGSKTMPEIAQNPARLQKSSVFSFLKDQTDAFRKMEKELNNDLDVGEPPSQKTLTPKQRSLCKSSKKTPKIIIAAISGPALHLNGKRSENEIFTTSIHELDVLIASKRQDQLSSINEIKQSATLASITASDDQIQIPQQYSEYSDVFSKTDSNILPPHRAYDHKIILEGEGEKALKYSPLYKMSLEELESVKIWITENLNKGFIEPSQSPFAAPILFVRKADGSLRLCIDFRTLNSLTRKDRYPLPLIDETLARLAGAKFFTKLDIRQAFHRIRMDPSSEEYTTFRTRYGAYKCKVLPFGLTNGPATYQRYMNDVLFDYLDDFCTAYLDDILIYSTNELEHTAHRYTDQISWFHHFHKWYKS